MTLKIETRSSVLNVAYMIAVTIAVVVNSSSSKYSRSVHSTKRILTTIDPQIVFTLMNQHSTRHTGGRLFILGGQDLR